MLCKNKWWNNSHLTVLRGADYQGGGGYIGVVPHFTQKIMTYRFLLYLSFELNFLSSLHTILEFFLGGGEGGKKTLGGAHPSKNA